ncbi:MAG: hypothetical protein Q8M91_12295 [Polaromonas sp.]|nr:hypothetical protein [Polaromonas sp.]MDP3311244.1 hypothetical protein [Polaromonas sp.]
MTMNSRILFRTSPLQQQPQRHVNQQQQQSSGSGEFQPRRGRQAQDSSVGGQGRQTGSVPRQAM